MEKDWLELVTLRPYKKRNVKSFEPSPHQTPPPPPQHTHTHTKKVINSDSISEDMYQMFTHIPIQQNQGMI